MANECSDATRSTLALDARSRMDHRAVESVWRSSGETEVLLAAAVEVLRTSFCCCHFEVAAGHHWQELVLTGAARAYADIH